MNYSQAGICNVALGRIGARGQLVSINDNTPNAIKCLAVWDTVFQEVLSERDWRFAKTRAQLQMSSSASFTGSITGNVLTVSAVTSGTVAVGQTVFGSNVLCQTIITAGGGSTWNVSQSQTVTSESMTSQAIPIYGYTNAWALPSDFLRFVRPHKRPPDRNGFAWIWGPEGMGWYSRTDPPFWPYGWPYVVETLPIDGNKYALTDYNGCYGPAAINYIRLITDYTQLMPGFVNCLQWRLAKELAINVTEDKQKFELCEDQYKQSLNSAEAQNECLDFVSYDEAGSTSWEDAGRRYCGRIW